MATIARKLTAIVTADTTGFDRGMRNVARTSKGTSKVVIGSAVAIGAAVVGIGIAALKAAASFETAVAEISTIAGVSEKGMGKIRSDLLDLSTEFGSTAKDNAKGFYQTVSSGITDTAEAMTVMRCANELAIAGLTNQETAVNVLTATMNAYGFSAAKAGEINDSLFTTVRLGRLRIEELAATLGRVMPIAANVGIKFDELNASIATVTLGGLRADAAITGIRALINSLINPAEGAAKALEEAGVSFGISALRAKGLKGIMEELSKALRDPNTNIGKLIPNIRALPAALLLAKNGAAKFNEILDEFGKKAGSANAATAKMSNTLDRRYKRSMAGLTKEMIAMGEAAKGPAITALKALGVVIKFVSQTTRGGASYYEQYSQAVQHSALEVERAERARMIASGYLTVSIEGYTKAEALALEVTLRKAKLRARLANADKVYAAEKSRLAAIEAAEARAAAGRLAEWSAALLKVNESTKTALKERTSAFRAHFAELTSLQAKRKSELESAKNAERSAFRDLLSFQEQGAAARFERKQRKASPADAAKMAMKEAARITKKAGELQAGGKGEAAGDMRRRAKTLLLGVERDTISTEERMDAKIVQLKKKAEQLKEQFSKGYEKNRLKAKLADLAADARAAKLRKSLARKARPKRGRRSRPQTSRAEQKASNQLARIQQKQRRLRAQFDKADTGKKRAALKAEYKATLQELKAAEAARKAAMAGNAKAVSSLTTAQTTGEKLRQENLDKTTGKQKTAEMALTDIIAKVTEFKEKSAGLKIDIKTETSEERMQRLITMTDTLIAKQAALQTKIAAAQPATAATTSTGTRVMSPAAMGRDKSASKFEAGLALKAPGAGAAAGPVTLNFNFSETISREEIREKVVPEIERVLDRNQTKREKVPA